MNQVEQFANDASMPALGVGDQLKAAREARRMSLGEVSQAIKISPRVLEQVEANAWGEMPGHTFARGMVRSYAKLLQIDPEPLLKSLEDAPLPKLPLLNIPSPTQASLPVAGQAQRRDRLTVAAGVLLVVLAALAYFIVPDRWLEKSSDNLASPEGSLASPPATLVPPVSPTAPADAVTMPAAGAPVAPGQEGSPGPNPGAQGEATSGSVVQPAQQPMSAQVPPAGYVTPPAAVSPPTPIAPPAPVAPLAKTAPAVQAVLPAQPTPPTQTVQAPMQPAATGLAFRFTGTSWIEVKDKNGAVVMAGNYDAGASRQVNGVGPFFVALGNADAVTVSYRGQPVDLKPHTRQKVARFKLE
jgi:cytoskeleton protein RodZ